MKLSLYTISLSGGYYDGPAVPLLDIFPKAKSWGYDGVEIEAKRPHGNPMDLSRDDRGKIKKVAADNGLEISCVAAYNDYSSPIDEHRENELLMTREQIRLAADLGCPFVRVFAAWSGVSRRNGRITYDLARFNVNHRFPGTIAIERWWHVRDCLIEASKMAVDAGVTLLLQNHSPIIEHHNDMLDFIKEVNSPGLKACLDAPLMHQHDEAFYREALTATGDLQKHTHFGGRFEQQPDGSVKRIGSAYGCDERLFLRISRELGFKGHVGYELCSPVFINHKYAGLEYAMDQCRLAAKYMRAIMKSI